MTTGRGDKLERFLQGDDGDQDATKLSIKELLRRELIPDSQKEATKRFCIDLPVSLHKRLSMAALRYDRPKTKLVIFFIKICLDLLTEIEDEDN